MSLELGFVTPRPATASCHASTLVATSEGLLAAWFGGRDEGEPDVGIWQARHDGGGWSAPERVADGGGEACWNPVLAAPTGAPLLLFYKVGADPTSWRGLVRRSSDGGRTWSPAEPLPDGWIGPVRSKPLEQGGDLLCGASVEVGGWRAHVEALDARGGPRWRSAPFEDPLGLRAIQPTLVAHDGAGLQALCRTLRKVVAETRSRDGGRTWSPLAPTSLENPCSGLEALRLRDGRALLVRNPSRDDRRALVLSTSADAGRTWRDALTVEEVAQGEVSYPAAIEGADGRLHITYTWRRERIRHVALRPALL